MLQSCTRTAAQICQPALRALPGDTLGKGSAMAVLDHAHNGIQWTSLPDRQEPWAASAIGALDGTAPSSTCVMVGSSPIVLGSSLGAAIDDIHHLSGGSVWRFNFAPTRGYVLVRRVSHGPGASRQAHSILHSGTSVT